MPRPGHTRDGSFTPHTSHEEDARAWVYMSRVFHDTHMHMHTHIAHAHLHLRTIVCLLSESPNVLISLGSPAGLIRLRVARIPLAPPGALESRVDHAVCCTTRERGRVRIVEVHVARRLLQLAGSGTAAYERVVAAPARPLRAIWSPGRRPAIEALSMQ